MGEGGGVRSKNKEGCGAGGSRSFGFEAKLCAKKGKRDKVRS